MTEACVAHSTADASDLEGIAEDISSRHVPSSSEDSRKQLSFVYKNHSTRTQFMCRKKVGNHEILLDRLDTVRYLVVCSMKGPFESI